MPRTYTGTTDGVSVGKRVGLEILVVLCHKRWATKNLGTHVVRDIRDKPGQLSVHATGRAADIQFFNRAALIEAIRWFIKHADALGVEELHDYAYGKYGRGWRVGRKGIFKRGWKGWKIYTATNNAGSIGAGWLHIEISPSMADNKDFELVWRGLPRP